MLSKIIIILENGECNSKTLRIIYRKYYKIHIGLYSYGCFNYNSIDPYTTIGRYCSINNTVAIRNRNHPIGFKSTHPFFFNSKLGYCKKEIIDYSPIEIGNDVWIGQHVIILPSVQKIGDGAIIGAHSVVTKSIPPYSIVVGNPARVIKFRFSNDIIAKLLDEKWWEKEINQILPSISDFQQNL